MTPGAAGLRRAPGRLGPCDPGRPWRAVGGVQKGNRRAAPFGSPRWAPSSARMPRQGHCPEGRRRAFAAPGAQRSVAGSGPAPKGRRPERTDRQPLKRDDGSST